MVSPSSIPEPVPRATKSGVYVVSNAVDGVEGVTPERPELRKSSSSVASEQVRGPDSRSRLHMEERRDEEEEEVKEPISRDGGAALLNGSAVVAGVETGDTSDILLSAQRSSGSSSSRPEDDIGEEKQEEKMTILSEEELRVEDEKRAARLEAAVAVVAAAAAVEAAAGVGEGGAGAGFEEASVSTETASIVVAPTEPFMTEITAVHRGEEGLAAQGDAPTPTPTAASATTGTPRSTTDRELSWRPPPIDTRRPPPPPPGVASPDNVFGETQGVIAGDESVDCPEKMRGCFVAKTFSPSDLGLGEARKGGAVAATQDKASLMRSRRRRGTVILGAGTFSFGAKKGGAYDGRRGTAEEVFGIDESQAVLGGVPPERLFALTGMFHPEASGKVKERGRQ